MRHVAVKAFDNHLETCFDVLEQSALGEGAGKNEREWHWKCFLLQAGQTQHFSKSQEVLVVANKSSTDRQLNPIKSFNIFYSSIDQLC